MKSGCACCSPSAGRMLQWAGRILATGLVLLFLVLIVGQGPPPVSVGHAALAIMLAGFLLTWGHRLYGGLMSLLGISAFYAWNYSRSGGFPDGWVFPLCFLPGILCIVGWIIQRFARPQSPV